MDDLVINDRVTIPGSELSIAFARSGGPGGQNVNKVSSKVDLRWSLASSRAVTEDDRAWLLQKLRSKLTSDGTLIITSQKTRDQLKNRDDATSKLVLVVRTALVRPAPRKASKPSKASKRRRVADKRHHAVIKSNRRGGRSDE